MDAVCSFIIHSSYEVVAYNFSARSVPVYSWMVLKLFACVCSVFENYYSVFLLLSSLLLLHHRF